jgi:hypothetical protein
MKIHPSATLFISSNSLTQRRKGAKNLDCGGSLPGRSAAATPLFDCGPGFQSGVAPALRDSRRSPNFFGCVFALNNPLRLCAFA